MRIVIGSIQQETNTFNPVLTQIDDFTIYTDSTMSGKTPVEDYFIQEGFDVIPTLYASAVPGGKLTASAFSELKRLLLERIPSDGPIDGIFLYCHGALEVDGIGSGERAILEAIRQLVGSKVPISLALDFHANIDEHTARLANIICGYRTAPHIDMVETQMRAARALVLSIKQGLNPVSALVRVPLIITGDKVITNMEPMCSIIRATELVGQEDGILDASVFNGQPWVDAPNTGASVVVVVTSHGNLDKAKKEANLLAKMLWDARDKYLFQAFAVEPREAVRRAFNKIELSHAEGTIDSITTSYRKDSPIIFISDSGDNTTAGAPGNRTEILEIMLDINTKPQKSTMKRTLIAGLTDSAMVIFCQNRTIGSLLVENELVDLADYSPMARALLLKWSAPKITSKGRILGWEGDDGGEYLVLSVNNLDIIITERRCAITKPSIIESAGVCIQDYVLIVVKLGYLYPELAAIADEAFLALTEGASCESIERITYKKIMRPIFPIDQDFSWSPTSDE